MWISSVLLCFFFQAEDGIRDLTVTGVQTCALPIFPGRAAFLDGRGGSSMRLNFSGVSEADIREGIRRLGEVVREQVDLYGTLTGVPRSEERRVGKERRSRWSPYH